MTKPYLRISHLIIEIIGAVLTLASVIYAAIFTIITDGQIIVNYDNAGNIGYGSPSTVLFLPITMFALIIVMVLCLHFLPDSLMNIPFTVKPERYNKVMGDIAYMITSMELLFGAFSLVFTIMFAKEIMHGEIISFILVGAIFVDLIIFLIKAYIDNK